MDLKLTSKERLVLYGLSRYPGLSDIDLAARIGVDRSTIFKSKRKFRDWQLIKLLNVPAGESVGAEILTGVFSTYRPTTEIDPKVGGPFTQWLEKPGCVFHTMTASDSVSIIYSRSLTEFKKNFDPFIDDYWQKGILEDVHCFHYPLQMTKYSADACLAVNDIFELAKDDLPRDLTSLKAPPDSSKLTDKDKLTLYAFIKHPMLSDLELSRRTGISRPTISGKRTKFFQTGLLNREAYIDWQKICCELLTFYQIGIKSRREEDLLKVHRAFRKIGAPLFSYIQPGESFGAFLSEGYPDLKKRMDLALKELFEQDLIDKRPMLLMMPLSDIGTAKIDYAPMVAELLGIHKEI